VRNYTGWMGAWKGLERNTFRLAEVNPWSNLTVVITALFAAFLPEDIVGEMTSIGTLFAFILVCIGVWILRVRRPELERAFKAPVLPFTAIMGILVCGAMIYGLGWTNWARLAGWMAIGLIIYFAYSRKHSITRNS